MSQQEEDYEYADDEYDDFSISFPSTTAGSEPPKGLVPKSTSTLAKAPTSTAPQLAGLDLKTEDMSSKTEDITQPQPHDFLSTLPEPDEKMYELDLNSFADKPWRRPGADITDYFNYGFTEETWEVYSQKQLDMKRAIKMGKFNNMMNTNNPNINPPNKMPPLPPQNQPNQRNFNQNNPNAERERNRNY